MHSKREDVPAVLKSGALYSRDVEWGDMNVAFKGFPAGTDSGPLFKGLPNDSCQCPHWGYVIKGSMRVKYADHEEVIAAGEAYHLPAGHNVVVDEDCEIVEFSPRDESQKTMVVAARNMKAMQGSG
ncbi:MAG TPA: hypothetical protein VF784_02055 [Anaerolineales bacterium]